MIYNIYNEVNHHTGETKVEDTSTVELTWKEIQVLSSLITMSNMDYSSKKTDEEVDLLISIQEKLQYTKE